jgi:hypothetical protein
MANTGQGPNRHTSPWVSFNTLDTRGIGIRFINKWIRIRDSVFPKKCWIRILGLRMPHFHTKFMSSFIFVCFSSDNEK